MRLLIVVFSEAGYVVESWIVEFECLPEPLYLPLRCGFSSGTEDMLDAMLRAVVGESAWAVVAPELRPMVGEDLLRGSTSREGYLKGFEDCVGCGFRVEACAWEVSAAVV